MERMTSKQESYLLYLANRVGNTEHNYLSQARDVLGLSSFQLQRISKAQASTLIDRLKKQLEEN